MRKLLVTHSMHRQYFHFPIDPNATAYSWDALTQALSFNYDTHYMPISEVEDIRGYDIILLWYDDICNLDNLVWEYIDDSQLVILLCTGAIGFKVPELYCDERSIIYERLQQCDILLGIIDDRNPLPYFCRDDAIISDIINPIDFDMLYNWYADIEMDKYSLSTGVLIHPIEPNSIVNWSESLLSMKLLNLLGYQAIYQSRMNMEEEDADFTNSLQNMNLDCIYHKWLNRDDYVRHLTRCSLMFEVASYPAASMAIVLALFAGLPCISTSSWYQKAIFPDLIINDSFTVEQIQLMDNQLKSDRYRNDIIDKGLSLARDIDIKVVSGQLHMLIEDNI